MIDRLRLECAALAAWLFLLFNVERLHHPLNIASFVYVLAALVAVALVGIRPLGAWPLPGAIAAPLLLYFSLKLFWGQPILGPVLPITVVEICAILLTTALAYQIADRARRLQILTAGIINQRARQPEPMDTAQSAMYREVRRARQHHRPVAVLAVDFSGASNAATPEKLVEELQRDLMDKFACCRVAELLAKEAKDHAIIAQSDRHFVVLLPETDRDAADQVVRQVNHSVKSSLGLKLRVGLSTFPDEEVTLVGLLERAELNMQGHWSSERRSGERGNEPATAETAEGMNGEGRRGEEFQPSASGAGGESVPEPQRAGKINGTDRHPQEAFVASPTRNNRAPT